MKKIKKQCIIIVGILLVFVMCLCLVLSFFCYQSMKDSIWGEVGLRRMFGTEKVYLVQWQYHAEEAVDRGDRIKLFFLLTHAKKYDKERDKAYLLDGYFLRNPKINFRKKKDDGDWGDTIFWEDKKGILYYYQGKKKMEYYLEKKYAQELKELFEKYISLQGKNTY